jgi:outer membrane protein p2
MMKKTLLALTVAALAASSAQAYKFQIQETGTDIDFNGSLRVKWESTSHTTDTYGSTPSQKKRSY